MKYNVLNEFKADIGHRKYKLQFSILSHKNTYVV